MFKHILMESYVYTKVPNGTGVWTGEKRTIEEKMTDDRMARGEDG